MKICPVCGTSNPDNQDVCLNCSQDLPVLDSDENYKQGSDSGASLIPGGLKLKVKSGLLPGREYVLDSPNMTVGRFDEENRFRPDIDLTEQEESGAWTISRVHARFSIVDGQTFVCDLGSTNGVYVNTPEPIAPHQETEIHPGDLIALGPKVVLKLKEVSS